MRRWTLALALLVAGAARADEDFFEPIALGMGGAGRVLAVDTSSMHLNPAALVMSQRVYAGMSYLHDLRERSHSVTTGAADAYTSDFVLGAQYTVRTWEPPFDPTRDLNWYRADDPDSIRDKRTWHRVDIAAGYGLFQRRLGIGLGARVLQQKHAIRADRTFFTLDAGLDFRITKFLLAGASAQNMIPTRDRRFPTRLSAGAALEFDAGWEAPIAFKAEVDVVWDFTSQLRPITDVHGGAEVRFVRVVALRGGYYSDRKFLDHYVCFGVGVVAPKARLDMGMRVEAGPMEKRLRDDKPLEAQRVVWNIGISVQVP